MQLSVWPIKTRAFLPPRDNLDNLLHTLPPLVEGDVVLVTSKVVAIAQGRCVRAGEGVSKDELVAREAEYIISEPGKHGVTLTIKEHTVIPWSGIDESNANGYYILWPNDPHGAARNIWQQLRAVHKLKNLAVIITDSHTTPLRYGVQGIAIGFYGLNPLRDRRGEKDIFGRPLLITQTNVVDSLANLGVLSMGEGNEQTPLAIIRGAEFVEFSAENLLPGFLIDPEADVYGPFLSKFKKV